MSADDMDLVSANDLAVEINEAHALAQSHMGSAIRYAFRAGELLVKSKAALPHGKWLPWLRENITFSERSAQAYMRLAKRLPAEIRNGAADLSVRKGLAYLATTRTHSMWDTLPEVTARCEARRATEPADELDRGRLIAENIRDLDGWFHRYGLCSPDDCTVCDAEAA